MFSALIEFKDNSIGERLEDEIRALLEKNSAQHAEDAKRAEAAKRAEEAKRAEAAQRAEEAKRAEAAKRAEEAKRAKIFTEVPSLIV